jgi:hypothetical protein
MVRDVRDVDLAKEMTEACLGYLNGRDESMWEGAAALLKRSPPEVAFRAGYLFAAGLGDLPTAGLPDPGDEEHAEVRDELIAKITDWLETNFSDI